MDTPGMRSEPAPLRLDMLLQVVVGVFVMRWTLRFLFRSRVRFAGPLPPGPLLFASNHRSFLDPPYVGMWLDRPMSYFARASLWRIPIVREFLDIFGGLPIDRGTPQMAIMKRTVAWLRAGRRILLFPEGTRTRDGRLGRLRDGAALFARRAGVPIVPVYIHNSDRVWPRGALLPRLGGARCEIRYGRALRPPEHLPPRRRDAVVTEYLRRWMQRQERALRGPPGP